MNPRNIALIVVGALVAGGVAIAVVFASTGGDATDTASTASPSATAEAPAPTEDAATESPAPTEEPAEASEEAAATPGAYVDYSPATLEAAEGEKVLFFHATWCPQCRALEADIQGAGVPDGVTVLKVDYDSNQDLRAKYGVTLQTTLVHVDDSGALIDRYVAYEQPVLAPSLAALGIAGS
ncbi:thioredoxin family protein [Agromyces mangrovi Wang et al. 2018]|uniref:thioredoxin family protein n=1 Tax=Agromyces mangrovi TaxID=1858653 RepID=UPI0025730593|nr:thioredoxin domain-containing protein [Agromyces mangrovi]